jgi:hypothetical protein
MNQSFRGGMQQARLGLLADIANDLTLSRGPVERGPAFGLLPRPLERPAAPHPSAEDLIREAVRGQIGLVSVRIPDLPHPIWLRAGTADVDACLAALSPETGLKIPYGARRILDLGMGAGYRTVALAHRFPNAEIIAAEADPALRTVALLNTLPYQTIKFLPRVVDLGGADYSFAGRFGPGGAPSLTPLADGKLTATPMATLLNEAGWKIFDSAVITLDPATLTILRHDWPKTLRMLAIYTGGQKLGPAAVAALGKRAEDARPAGHYVLIMPREIEDVWPAPAPVPVYDPLGAPKRLTYTRPDNLPARHFSIFPHGFRLHPNGPKQPAATLSLSHTCQSFAALRVRLRVAHKDSNPVTFTISVLDPAGGEPIGHAEVALAAGRDVPVEVSLRPFFGPCRVLFKTEMVENAPNQHAWAEFLDPVFV